MKATLLIIALCVLCVCSLFNKKINVFKIIVKQFSIYKNDRTKKYSIFDIFTFIVVPIAMAVILVFLLEYSFLKIKADLFITVLSIISTVLFSFLTLLIEKKNNSDNKKEIQVSNETYISIIMTILYSMISIGLLIVLLVLPDIKWLIMLISGICYCLLIKITLHLLMVLKRMFLLL